MFLREGSPALVKTYQDVYPTAMAKRFSIVNGAHTLAVGAAASVLLAGFLSSGGCATNDQLSELEKEYQQALKDKEDRAPAECHPGVKEPCYEGPDGTAGRGICREGARSCDERGRWLECEDQTTPAASELCNKTDDDCNGTVDDGFQREGTKCWAGEGECRSEGTYRCAADGSASECNAPVIAASAEICDGKDNDCDGQTDEDDTKGTGTECATGQKGACAAGVTKCIAGAVQCMPSHTRTVEVCENSIDDNCDGKTDEKGCVDPEDLQG